MSNQNLPANAIFSTNYAVRIFTDENQNPWFCHTDICDVLGYKNSRTALSNHCKGRGILKKNTPISENKCDVLKQDTTSKARKNQMLTYINEGNLYRLIVKSKKPEAEQFEEWLFEEVLPQIRKTGSYHADVDASSVETASESDVKVISVDQLERIRVAIQNCTRYLKHYRASMAQTMYKQMKAKFTYDKIKNLPADQFSYVMEWIQNHEPVCHDVYNLTGHIEKEFIKHIKTGDYQDISDIPEFALSSCKQILISKTT